MTNETKTTKGVAALTIDDILDELRKMADDMIEEGYVCGYVYADMDDWMFDTLLYHLEGDDEDISELMYHMRELEDGYTNRADTLYKLYRIMTDCDDCGVVCELDVEGFDAPHAWDDFLRLMINAWCMATDEDLAEAAEHQAADTHQQ